MKILFRTLPRVSLSFEDTEVTTIIKQLAKLADGNVVIAEDVGGTLSLQLEDVTWRAALDNVVKTIGFQVVEEDSGILRIVSIETLRGQRSTAVFPLRYVLPPREYRPVIDTEFADGGPEGSGGVYIGREDLIKVPMTSLGVEFTGVRFIVDHKKRSDTLTHELVHQLTRHWPYSTPVWLTEGIAEVVQVQDYDSGRFSISNMDRAIKERNR